MSTHVHEEERAMRLFVCMRRIVQRVYLCAWGGACNVSSHVHEGKRATCLHVYEEERVKCPSLCMRRKVQRVYQ